MSYKEVFVSLFTVSKTLVVCLRPVAAFFTFFIVSLCLFTSVAAAFQYPIFIAMLFVSIANLLLVSYWSAMANINPARQMMAFSLFRVSAPEKRLHCVAAQYTVRG